MKNLLRYIILLVFVFLVACDVTVPEYQCLPQRVKTTLSTGAGAASITADYKYEGNVVDRIIWSNSQTHYFSYDAQNQISKIEEVNVKTLLETEYRFSYDGNQLMRVDQYLSPLDYLTQEPVDTAYVGYQSFTHEGANISEEELYVWDTKKEDFKYAYRKEYDYDLSGNVIKYVSIDVKKKDTVEAYTFSYDLQKNPFKGLNLYFNGETFVNNIVEKVDLVNDNTYSYQIIYNANQYPSQVNIKEDGLLYEVVTFDFICE